FHQEETECPVPSAFAVLPLQMPASPALSPLLSESAAAGTLLHTPVFCPLSPRSPSPRTTGIPEALPHPPDTFFCAPLKEQDSVSALQFLSQAAAPPSPMSPCRTSMLCLLSAEGFCPAAE